MAHRALGGSGTIKRLAWRSRLRAVPFNASEQGRDWDPPRFSVFKRGRQPSPALTGPAFALQPLLATHPPALGTSSCSGASLGP